MRVQGFTVPHTSAYLYTCGLHYDPRCAEVFELSNCQDSPPRANKCVCTLSTRVLHGDNCLSRYKAPWQAGPVRQPRLSRPQVLKLNSESCRGVHQLLAIQSIPLYRLISHHPAGLRITDTVQGSNSLD